MDKGADKIKAIQVKGMPLMQKHRSSSVIQTTLYELMEAVIDVADTDEKRLLGYPMHINNEQILVDISPPSLLTTIITVDLIYNSPKPNLP